VEDLFGAIRDQFVAAELAPPGRRLVTGPEKRPLFEDEHGLSRFGQSVGDRRAAGAAADDDEIELGPHRAPSSLLSPTEKGPTRVRRRNGRLSRSEVVLVCAQRFLERG